MALTEQQRKQLIEKVNSFPIKTILSYFQSGDVTFSDVPEISPERKQFIEEQLDKMPNPAEQSEWNDIVSMLENTFDDVAHKQLILQKLSSYIQHWEGSRPNGNHVDEAHSHYAAVEDQIRNIAAAIEKSDWDNVL